MPKSQPQPTGRVLRPSANPTGDPIVAAAADLFSERSFDGATTREIVARAGVTRPLLNYHFRSKEELWQAAVDSLFDLLNQTMDERATGLRGVDEITSAKLRVREFITFSARNPHSTASSCRSPRLTGLGWTTSSTTTSVRSTRGRSSG